jgi:alpha-D-ribose 1-methylphosphonate 5-triphosphate synthase subunit PhnL
MNKLTVTDLRKTFTVWSQGGKLIEGFNSMSFALEEGEFAALMGPSGAGKSSLLKCLYRTYLPTAGSVELTRSDGSAVDIARLDEAEIIDLRRGEIGYVSQFLKVLPRVSALNVAASPLIDAGESEAKSLEAAAELLSRLGIRDELFDISPLTFSGGEQQRVNIARAVIAPKKLLLLDEPTASLDPVRTDIVMEILESLKKRGITMVGIFHDERLSNRIADKVIRMERVDAESGISI